MAEPSGRWDRLRPTLYDLAVETFAVFLGITVALLASAWQTRHSEREQAETTRRSIVEELEANRGEVARSHAYHGGLLRTLRPLMPPGQAAPGLDVFNQGFIRPAEILTTAWDVAGTTGTLAYMDYDEVLAFSHVYAAQRRYDETSAMSGRIIYDALFQEGAPRMAENYRRLYALISASYYVEEQLLARYLDTLGPDPAAPGSGRVGAPPPR